jgi:hypothetical protein
VPQSEPLPPVLGGVGDEVVVGAGPVVDDVGAGAVVVGAAVVGVDVEPLPPPHPASTAVAAAITVRVNVRYRIPVKSAMRLTLPMIKCD